MSTEEKLVRLAYRKLEIYNVASNYRDGLASQEISSRGKRLSLQLSGFRVGKIEEITSELYDNVMGRATGEIIQLSHSAVSENGEENQVAYGARWVTGQHATIFDRNWTIGDILKIETTKYYDVTRYASYEVTVSLESKTRTYRALALIHGPIADLKVEVWDAVVGMGGAVTKILAEQRLPYGMKPVPNKLHRYDREEFAARISSYLSSANWADVSSNSPSLSCPSEALNLQPCCISEELARFWGTNTCNVWSEKAVGSASLVDTDLDPESDIQFYDEDDLGHISGTGVHHGRARFRPECTTISSTRQRCNVQVRDQGYGDNPDNHTDIYFHVGTRAETSRGNEGPRGQNLECDAGVGFAFDYCFFTGCNVDITLSLSGRGAGVSATVTGGTLWRTARAQGNVCNIPATTTSGLPGGCNESAEYGCQSGFVNVDGICTRSTSFTTQCTRFGGYEPESCACTGGCYIDGMCSPIVVDVLGNGFNMTSPSTGVLFDMAGQGTAERFSWTAENSDDAWLALDRNNNGLIDSGRELFGNVTAQDIHPEGVERNGFLALALYDSPAYGGNGDGVISQLDSIFSRLKLWRDDNHNGVSESCELFALPDLGLEKIDLDYRNSRRVDEHGNEFRYRSKVRNSHGSEIGRWAWDVFLVRQP